MSEEMKREANAKSDISGFKADMGHMKSDLGGLKTDVGHLKTDVSGLKADVGHLKTDVSGLKADMGALKSDMAQVKDGISSIIVMMRRLAVVTTKTSADLADFKKYAHENFVTRDEFHSRMDGLSGKVDDMRLKGRRA